MLSVIIVLRVYFYNNLFYLPLDAMRTKRFKILPIITVMLLPFWEVSNLFSHFCSILDCLNTKLLKPLKVLLHGPELFRGVSLPICDLTGDPKRIPGTV